MSKIIIVRRINDKEYTVTADGKTRKGFISIADAKEWLGCMQAHGLFPEYRLFEESTTGALNPLQTTYENPCKCPTIALAL